MRKLTSYIIGAIKALFTKPSSSKSDAYTDEYSDFDSDTLSGERKFSLARTAATTLTIASAALVSSIETQEGVVTTAYKDSGGVVTIGSGTTQYRTGERAGSKVRMGDTITREEARGEVIAYLDEQGKRILATLQKPDGTYVELYQEEFDIIQDFVYQYGMGNWTKSSIRSAYLNGEYIQACENYLKYKYVGKTDCSKSGSNCRGVWIRSQKRRDDCLAAASAQDLSD